MLIASVVTPAEAEGAHWLVPKGQTRTSDGAWMKKHGHSANCTLPTTEHGNPLQGFSKPSPASMNCKCKPGSSNMELFLEISLLVHHLLSAPKPVL